MQGNHLEASEMLNLEYANTFCINCLLYNLVFVFLFRIAGHPLAQNERCLHMFLQEESIDRNYIPGKVRQ